ncbi:antibiotic biosynthesis monooxygenase family protein [Calditrichota bacterium]
MVEMFIAMNRITCSEEYRGRFEELFATRAKEVDKMPGFIEAKILRPVQDGKPYIIMTYWEAKEHFDEWVNSDAFRLGHTRGFKDIAQARKEGKEPPISSDMENYEVFAT